MTASVPKTLRVAVVGCLHGELDAVYRTIEYADAQCGRNTDLVLICGDFQASRDQRDLSSMAVATFYRRFGDYKDYYEGHKRAPILSIFVGGNHEASTHLWDLYHGGWIAPNIYYMGTTGVVTYRGLRICGVSGIAKAYDYAHGYACPPPDPTMEPQRYEKWCRSVYHLRDYEFFRLASLRCSGEDAKRMDVVLSHDWPAGIAREGDTETLYRCKRDFRAEADSIGSPQLRGLMGRMQPRYWFAGHHHIKHAVLVRHPTGTETRFLALSKVLPGYDFMQFVEIPVGDAEDDGELRYDLEWLHSVHATAPLFPVGEYNSFKFPQADTLASNAFAMKAGDVLETDNTVLSELLKVPPCSTISGLIVDPPAEQKQRFFSLLVRLFGPFQLQQQQISDVVSSPPTTATATIAAAAVPATETTVTTTTTQEGAVENPEEIPLDC